MSTLDRSVESLGRWTARRTSRRSFLHRVGQLAVVVAAGPSIATLLTRRADARVCGQSGVTPKCDTFDCVGPGDVWGWCWYASDGCCRNGGLKKICDCCTVDYPNVHGYCPSGTNVRCIVESCGTDPRLQTVTLSAVAWRGGDVGYYQSAVAFGHLASGRPATRAVLAPASNAWLQYIAAPLAGSLGAPFFAVGANGPDAPMLGTLADLGVEEVLTVGPIPGIGRITGTGVTVEAATLSSDPVVASIEVADRIRSVNDINRTVTVARSGLSADAAPYAAAFAALGGFPLMVTVAAATTVGRPTLFVAINPTGAAADLVHDKTASTSLEALSAELGALAAALPTVNAGSGGHRVAIAPAGSSDVIGLANLGVPVVAHPPDRLGHLEQWLQAYSLRWGELDEVYFVDGPGELITSEYWKLQAAVNGYRVDQLQGVAGEGLPVIRQPMAERPIGLARTDGAFDWGSQSPPAYWTRLGQTLRN